MSAEAPDRKSWAAAQPPKPPENSLSASRRRRQGARPAPDPKLEKSAASSPPTGTTSTTEALPSGKRTDSDPWTVPQSVRDRFIQEGNRFHFPDGTEAFRDRGRKLTTSSANTEVIGSLVEIARNRGWTEVTLAGTEAFRREAWRQARLAGLDVRGYRPTPEARAQLIRSLARVREDAREPVEPVSADPHPGGGAAPRQESRWVRIRGKLLEHGQDFYRHDPQESVSYFVRLQTPDGKQEVWGKDIQRALAQSLSQPKIGDEVVLQRTGQKPVTVRRQTTDDRGQVREQPHAALRNRWALETVQFMDQRAAAAQVVRNVSVRPQEAVRERPELTGTYLDLKAAELAARTLKDPADQRRFVQRVRLALARDIERGEPLHPVRIRDRGSRLRPRELDRDDLAPQR